MSGTLRAAALAVATLVGFGCSACDGGESDGAVRDSGSDREDAAATADADAPDADAAASLPSCDLPEPGADGWEAFTDWSDGYPAAKPFWIATDPGNSVRPIEWEPCHESAPTGIDCRMMRICWDHRDVDRPVLSVGSALGSFNGEQVLFFGRIARGRRGRESRTNLYAIAQVDGPVSAAIVLHSDSTIYDLFLTPAGIDDATYGFSVRGTGVGWASTSPRQGVIVGRVGERPFVFREEMFPSSSITWAISSEHVARIKAPARLLPLDGGEPVILESPRSPGIVIMVGARAFWDSGGLLEGTIYAYDPDVGSTALIGSPAVAGQGDYNIGTDGQHLVWTHGEGASSDSLTFAARSIMTAPVTFDPGEVAPRRLRSDPTASYNRNFVVGCEHASHTIATPTSFGSVLVVRLSDGQSWTLAKQEPVWEWLRPIGITCDDIFVEVRYRDDIDSPRVWNIARVRLDSLGPGDPPD